MAINPILYENQCNKLPEIYQDYLSVRNLVTTDKDEKDSIFETIPIYNKAKELAQNISSKDYGCTSALATLAILNGPEEIGDLFSAMKQIKSQFTGKPYNPPYDNKIAQHPFSFFRGTILKDYMNPNTPECVFPKISGWLLMFDKSLLETKLGQFICKKMGVEINDIPTNIKDIYYTEDFPKFVKAKTFKTNNPFKELIARSMARTPVLSTAAIIGIGSIHVKHKVDDGADLLKEIRNTALGLGTTIIGVGSLGALGAKYFGATGSLLGVAAGTLIGAKVSRTLS